jgi:hypothetical protein
MLTTGTSMTSCGPRRHIVLVGAGHAHVGVLRDFCLRPDPSVRLTLVTPGRGLALERLDRPKIYQAL